MTSTPTLRIERKRRRRIINREMIGSFAPQCKKLGRALSIYHGKRDIRWHQGQESPMVDRELRIAYCVGSWQKDERRTLYVDCMPL